jgi:hypothetical protein
MKTLQQRTPLPAFKITIDQATGCVLALNARQDPAQYAAGLLMRLCATAVATNQRPEDVLASAVAYVVSRQQLST